VKNAILNAIYVKMEIPLNVFLVLWKIIETKILPFALALMDFIKEQSLVNLNVRSVLTTVPLVKIKNNV
jgi:hypothetical protein